MNFPSPYNYPVYPNQAPSLFNPASLTQNTTTSAPQSIGFPIATGTSFFQPAPANPQNFNQPYQQPTNPNTMNCSIFPTQTNQTAQTNNTFGANPGVFFAAVNGNKQAQIGPNYNNPTPTAPLFSTAPQLNQAASPATWSNPNSPFNFVNQSSMQAEENNQQCVQQMNVNMQPQMASGGSVTLAHSPVSQTPLVSHRKIYQVNKANPLPQNKDTPKVEGSSKKRTMNNAGIGLANRNNYNYSPFPCFPLRHKTPPFLVRCISALEDFAGYSNEEIRMYYKRNGFQIALRFPEGSVPVPARFAISSPQPKKELDKTRKIIVDNSVDVVTVNHQENQHNQTNQTSISQTGLFQASVQPMPVFSQNSTPQMAYPQQNPPTFACFPQNTANSQQPFNQQSVNLNQNQPVTFIQPHQNGAVQTNQNPANQPLNTPTAFPSSSSAPAAIPFQSTNQDPNQQDENVNPTAPAQKPPILKGLQQLQVMRKNLEEKKRKEAMIQNSATKNPATDQPNVGNNPIVNGSNKNLFNFAGSSNQAPAFQTNQASNNTNFVHQNNQFNGQTNESISQQAVQQSMSNQENMLPPNQPTSTQASQSLFNQTTQQIQIQPAQSVLFNQSVQPVQPQLFNQSAQPTQDQTVQSTKSPQYNQIYQPVQTVQPISAQAAQPFQFNQTNQNQPFPIQTQSTQAQSFQAIAPQLSNQPDNQPLFTQPVQIQSISYIPTQPTQQVQPQSFQLTQNIQQQSPSYYSENINPNLQYNNQPSNLNINYEQFITPLFSDLKLPPYLTDNSTFNSTQQQTNGTNSYYHNHKRAVQNLVWAENIRKAKLIHPLPVLFHDESCPYERYNVPAHRTLEQYCERNNIPNPDYYARLSNPPSFVYQPHNYATAPQNSYCLGITDFDQNLINKFQPTRFANFISITDLSIYILTMCDSFPEEMGVIKRAFFERIAEIKEAFRGFAREDISVTAYNPNYSCEDQNLNGILSVFPTVCPQINVFPTCSRTYSSIPHSLNIGKVLKECSLLIGAIAQLSTLTYKLKNFELVEQRHMVCELQEIIRYLMMRVQLRQPGHQQILRTIVYYIYNSCSNEIHYTKDLAACLPQQVRMKAQILRSQYIDYCLSNWSYYGWVMSPSSQKLHAMNYAEITCVEDLTFSNNYGSLTFLEPVNLFQKADTLMDNIFIEKNAIHVLDDDLARLKMKIVLYKYNSYFLYLGEEDCHIEEKLRRKFARCGMVLTSYSYRTQRLEVQYW